jgi:autotransporter-associated beta strand protein
VLNAGSNGIYGGIAAIGVSGGTGTMNVTGGLFAIAADGLGATLDIGSRGGNGTLNISGGTVQAFAGITIGNVYGHAGSVGSLVLDGGLLDLASNGYGAAASMIVAGSGGSLVANSGTLQNVSEILGNATITGSGQSTSISGTPMPLTVSSTGILVLAGKNSYSGGTTVLSGTVDFSTPESMPSTGILAIESGGEVVLGAIVDDGGDSEPAVAAADIASNVASAQSAIESLLARLRAERAGESGHGSAVGAAGSVTAAVSPAVPEPSTFALLGVAVAGLLGHLWRRRRTG